MFLSRLPVRIGGDSNRPQPGRLWLRNAYHVHQRLCMAFPNEQWQPNVARTDDGGVGLLFRVDPSPNGCDVLVQSAVRPDWEQAFANARHFLAGEIATYEFDPDLFCRANAVWRFRLRANPTQTATQNLDGGRRKRNRHALRSQADQEEWLRRKAARGGFDLLDVVTTCEGMPAARKTVYGRPDPTPDRTPEPTHHTISLLAVRFEGRLRVTNAASFRSVFCGGIGPAKGLGFGLLSLAKAPPVPAADEVGEA